MKTPTRLAIAAIPILVFVLWLAWREAALSRQEASIDSQLAENRRITIALRAERLAVAESRAPNPAIAPAAPQTATPHLKRARRLRERLIRLPEYAPYLRRESQLRAMAEYGEWFEQSGARSERLPVIKQAIADHVAAQQEAFEAAIAEGFKMATPEFETLQLRYRQEAEARLREVLTPDEFASYSAYEKVKWFRVETLPAIREIFGDLGAAALTSEQTDALARAWQTAHAWKPEAHLKPGQLNRERNARVLAQVGSVLTADQRAALAEYIEYVDTKSRRMGELFRPDDPDGATWSTHISR